MRLLGGGYLLFCLMTSIGALLQTIMLSKSPNAFDDQYEGCTDEMEIAVRKDLLYEEKSKYREFASAWNDAERRWQEMKLSVPSGFKDEYGIAIMVYSNKNSNVYSSFNSDVRAYHPSTFRYYALHFYLTRGVQLLRSSCWWAPWKVYRGMQGVKFSEPTIGEEIRLGQFSSSSTNKNKAEEYGKDVLFTISSCFGVDIKKFSYNPEDEEILIPVDETFQVTNFTVTGEEQRWILKTTYKRCHYYNCEYLSKHEDYKGGRSSSCVDSGGMRISSSVMMFSLLLGFLALSLP